MDIRNREVKVEGKNIAMYLLWKIPLLKPEMCERGTDFGPKRMMMAPYWTRLVVTIYPDVCIELTLLLNC